MYLSILLIIISFLNYLIILYLDLDLINQYFKIKLDNIYKI